MANLEGNPFENLTKYELVHLAEHLEVSGQEDILHRILSTEVGGGRNAWYEIKEMLGYMESYLRDVRRAWTLSEQAFRITRSGIALGFQVRYALIESSVHSVADVIPNDLLPHILETELWAPEKVLNHISQKSDQGHQADAYLSVLPYLPGPLKNVAFELAQKAGGWHNEQLCELLKHNSIPDELKEKVLWQAFNLSTIGASVNTLKDFIPYLSMSDRNKLLEEAHKINDLELIVEVYSKLYNYVPEHTQFQLLNEVLAYASYLAKTTRGAAIVSEFFKLLSPESQDEYLNEYIKQVRATKHEISDPEDRASILCTLLPFSKDNHARAEIIDEVLELITSGNSYHRNQLLSFLVANFPRDIDESIVLRTLNYLTRKSQPGGDNFDSAKALVDIARHLPAIARPDVLRDAIDLASNVSFMWGDNQEAIVELWSGLMRLLPEELIHEALLKAQKIIDKSERAAAIGVIAPYLLESMKTEVLLKTLDDSIGESLSSNSGEIVKKLINYLPPETRTNQMRQLLHRTRLIGDQWICVQCLCSFHSTLRENVVDQALPKTISLIREIELPKKYVEARYRAALLVQIANALPNPLKLPVVRMAMKLVGKSEWPEEKFAKISAYLPNDVKDQLIAAEAGLLPDMWKRNLYGSLGDHLPDDKRTELLQSELDIRDKVLRVETLIGLAKFLPNDMVRIHAISKALQCAQEISQYGNSIEDRCYAIGRILPYLTETKKTEVIHQELNFIRKVSIGYENNRITALQNLFPYLPDALKREAYATILEFDSPLSKAHLLEALTLLVPYLSDPLKTEVIYSVLDNEILEKYLPSVCPLIGYLSTENQASIIPKLWQIAWNLKDDRADALSSLAPLLPNELKIQALKQALVDTKQDREFRSKVYGKTISEWEQIRFSGFDINENLWQETLHLIALYPREELYEDLGTFVPLIDELGSINALSEVASALCDTARWWT